MQIGTRTVHLPCWAKSSTLSGLWDPRLTGWSQFFIHIATNDRVERLVARKPERPRSRRVQRPRPACDDSRDSRVALPPHAPRDLGSGDALERGHHLAGGHGNPRHVHDPVRSKCVGGKLMAGNQARDGGRRRREPEARARVHRAHGILAVQRLANDTAGERRRSRIRPSGSNADGWQPKHSPVDEAPSRVVADQQLGTAFCCPVRRLRSKCGGVGYRRRAGRLRRQRSNS